MQRPEPVLPVGLPLAGEWSRLVEPLPRPGPSSFQNLPERRVQPHWVRAPVPLPWFRLAGEWLARLLRELLREPALPARLVF